MSARAGARRALALGGRALASFLEHGGPQSAAAISYYALLALFPLAILMVVVFGMVLDDGSARRQVIDFLLDNVPLREQQGRAELEELLSGVTRDVGGFGIAGGIGLLVAATGVMGAIRKALNRVWEVDDPRPFAQAKGIDLLLVAGLGLLVALSFALTLVTRLAASLSGEVGGIVSAVLALGQLLPAVIAFGLFTLLFSVVPASSTRVRDVWPGALVAAAGFEAAKTLFALYLSTFADYAAVYASLGAVVAFLVFVFVSANVVLLGAEVGAAWPAVRDTRLDPGGPPLRARLRDAIAGVFVRRG